MNAATAVAKEPADLEAAFGVIQKIEDIERRIAQCTEEYRAAVGEANHLESELYAVSQEHNEALRRLKTTEDRHEGGDSLGFLQSKVAAASRRHDEIRVRHANAGTRMKERNAELQHLQNEVLPAAKSGVTMQAILQQQDLLAAAVADVRHIEQLIAAQRELAAQARASVPEPATTEGERQDLLAAIAAGSSTSAALEDLDKKIVEERAAIDKATKAAGSAISNAESTIAGLDRRLQAAQEHQQAISEEGKRLLCSFLHTEAEAAGAQYVELAKAARAQLIRVRAIENLLRESGEQASFFHHNAGRFWMPSLRLQACADGRFVGELCSAERDSNGVAYQKATDSERTALRKTGVKI